jgi:hypothetical protein
MSRLFAQPAALLAMKTAAQPSTMAALAEYLRTECYQPSCYHIGSGWNHCGDTHCLEKTTSGYEAFYVERGQRSTTFFIEADEAIVCRKFLELLDRESWSRTHCIAFTAQLSDAERIEHELAAVGVRSVRNDIPAYRGPDDSIYRLFVFGRDLPMVEQMVASGQIPAVSLQ